MTTQIRRTMCVGAALVCLTFASAGAEPQPGHLVSPGVALSGDRHPSADRWANPTAPLPEVTGEGIRLPAEASPARKRQVRAEFMSSSQIAAYLQGGGTMAILPVGGVAAAGAGVPMGADGLIVHAQAVLLADRWGAIALPPVPYSYAGAAKGSVGTVSLAEDVAMAYIRAATESLLDGGFTRVVILGRPPQRNQLLGMTRTLYRDRKQVVIPCWVDLLPGTDEVTEQLGFRSADDIRALAAIRLLGYPGFEGPAEGTAPTTQPAAADDLLTRMRQAGVGVTPAVGPPSSPMPRAIRPEDVDKAIAIMRKQARAADALPAVYDRYIEQIADQEAFAPWSLQSWDKAVAACQYDKVIESHLTAAPAVEAKSTDDVVLPAAWFVQETSPAYLRRYRAEFMTAAEMAERMKSDPIAVLPAGAFEMHGPHAPLATDTFQAHAHAVMTAPHYNAIVFPPVYFTYGGATERYPGTVSPSHYETAHYVQAVVEGLFDAGFRRVAILWIHGPGRQMSDLVVKNIHHDSGRVVFSIRPRLFPNELMTEQLGYGRGEDIGALAGMKILGHPNVFVVDEPEDVGEIKLPFHTVVEFGKMSSRPPWYMGLPTHHLAVRKCVRTGDDDKLIPIMREAAAAYADAPALMDEYLQRVRQGE